MNLSAAERDMMARIVALEAGQEDDTGQQAVAHVILNRVASGRFGRDVESVIRQPWAFESYMTRRADFESMPTSSAAYQRALRNVEAATRLPDVTGGATHFFSPSAQAAFGRQPPAWATEAANTNVIGRHNFYAPEGRVDRAQANQAALPPLPEGFTLLPAGGQQQALPPLPEGFTLLPSEAPVTMPTPPVPEPRPLSAPPDYGQLADQTQRVGAQRAEQQAAAQQASPQPQPQAAPPAGPPLPAPNLDDAFAYYQGGLQTQGTQAAEQRSIPEIVVRPRGTLTARQRAQLAAEREMDQQSMPVRVANTVVRGLARGVNPFMDDTAAFLDTITGRGEGASFGERYANNLAVQRGVNDAADARNPFASYGAQLAGAAVLPVGNMAAPANALTRFGRGAAVGAGYGAAYGAGQGDMDLQDRLQRAATGAAIGGAVGGPLNAMIGPRLPQVQNQFASRPTAQEVVAAAERQGVQVPRAVLSDNMMVQRAGQAARNVPFAGDPIVKSTDRMVGQMGQRMDDLAASASSSGAVQNRETVGAAARASIENTVRNVMPARADELYSRVEQMMPAGQTYPLTNTTAAAQDIIARTRAAGLGDSQAVRLIMEAATRPGGLTYQGLRDLRTRLSEIADFGPAPSGMSNAELKQIVGALTRDIDAAVASAGPRAQQAYDRANQWYRGWVERRQTLGRILQAQSDEQIVERIALAASSRASGDIWRLSTARKSMGADEWSDIVSQVVSRLGRGTDGQFSPQKFLSDYQRLSERGKDILFRAGGQNRALGQALDDIATISSRWKEVGRFGNPSGTAQNWTGIATGAYAMFDPISAASSLVGANVLARILGSAPTAASMARWARAYDVAVRNPTAASLATLQVASRNFASTLGEKAGVTVDPIRLMQPVTDAITRRRPGQSETDHERLNPGVE